MQAPTRLRVRLPLIVSLVLLFSLQQPSVRAGDGKDGDADQTVSPDAKALETAVHQAELLRLSAEEAFLKIYEQSQILRKALNSQKAEADEALATLNSAKNSLATEEKAAKEAEQQAQDAAKAAAETAKIAEAAKVALTEKTAALEQTRQTIASATRTLEQAQAQAKKLDERLAGYSPDLNQVVDRMAKAAQHERDQRHELSEALIKSGKLISFSKQIAPIFAARCLACHNARTTEGRLNLETFAALQKGGDSGQVIEPGDGEYSTLFMMVEDGSMPKKADPLSKEELDLLRRWIDLGASLDYGADPDAQITSLMPKPAQPAPPEEYRVPVPVTAATFSPDGNLLATSGYHEVLVWDATSGKLVQRVTNLAERIGDIAYSPDGSLMAVAAGTPGQLGEVKLFRTSDGQLQADLVRSSDSQFTVAFSPDGTLLATGGADRVLRIFDVLTLGERLSIDGHADWLMDVAWSADGKQVVTASRDKTAKIFDIESGETKVTFTSHGEPVYGAEFTPDGKQVVSCGGDKKIRIWNAEDARQVREIGGFGGEVFRIAVTPDGRIFDCGSDTYVRLHRIDNGERVITYKGHQDWVYCLSYHPGKKRLASGGYDGEVRLWNIEDGTVVTKFTAAPGFKGDQQTASAK